MSYDSLLEKLPEDLRAHVFEAVGQEAEELAREGPQGRRARAHHNDIALKYQEAKEKFMQLFGHHMQNPGELSPVDVLNHRHIYVVAWAVAKVMKG